MAKKAKASKKQAVSRQAAAAIRKSKTDPLGSYTGRPAEPLEAPAQDADDL